MNEILKKSIEEAAVWHADSIQQSDERKEYSREDFIAGAKFALSHQLISVDEAIPECSVMVIVKDKYGNYDTAYLSKKGYWIANDGKEIIVSFWMPIPKFETKSSEYG